MTYIVKPKSEFQAKLFADLTKLVANSDGEFLTKNYPIEGHDNLFYQVFTYSLPKYSDFNAPNALNCRGTMFLVDKNTGEAELIALPMEKFFSLGEGGQAESKLKIEDAKLAYLKVDGSLLTSYIDPITQKTMFKSKNVPSYLNYEIVQKSIPKKLLNEITKLAKENISVDLELTTPENRVMIEYDTYAVHVLKARSTLTGEYINIRSLTFVAQYPAIGEYLVEEFPVNEVDINRKDIEGYVLEFPNGKMLKVKTLPYLSIVAVISVQDLSKISEYLYKAAVDEVLDEVRSLYHYRNQSENYPIERLLEQANIVEAYASKTYNELVKLIDGIYEDNKHLDRGAFAKMASTSVDKAIMPYLMNKYIGREVDYKALAVKLYAKKALSQ